MHVLYKVLLPVALPASDMDVADEDMDAHSLDCGVAGVDVNISSYTPSPLSKSIATQPGLKRRTV